MRLENKVAIVTGGAQGIGKEKIIGPRKPETFGPPVGIPKECVSTAVNQVVFKFSAHYMGVGQTGPVKVSQVDIQAFA